MLDGYGLIEGNRVEQERSYFSARAAYEQRRSVASPSWQFLGSSDRHAWLMTARALADAPAHGTG